MSTLTMHPTARKMVSFAPKATAENITDLVPYLKDLSLGKSNEKLELLVKALMSSKTEDSVLVNWLTQLKDNIFALDKENDRIVSALLSMQWTSRSDKVVSCYHNLILNLVSAHPSYVRAVLLMIIKTFSIVDESQAMQKTEMYKKAHALLQDIFLLIPFSQALMSQLIAEKFPYMKHQRQFFLSYSLNVLNVCCYLPTYRMNLLENLLDKYLQIDLQCTRDIITEFENQKKEQEASELHMDLGSSEDMAFPLANTLDLLLDGLFKYIECTCYSAGEGKLDWEVTKKLYRELLTLFDKLILPSSRCSHLQFVMFYICSLNSSLCEGFLQYLWKKVNDPQVAPLRRQFAAFYIGSFLARASYVTVPCMIACYDLMSLWVHGYISNCDSLNSVEIGSHGTFYSVCQALFYVFAFRHKEFINMPNGFKYLRCLNFERIVTCRLNPLKFCQPVIVQNFASIARNLQIAYCYPIIERNSRSLNAANICSPLITFFPFDPYLLKRSKRWIEPLYRLYDSQNDDESMERDEDVSLLDESGIQATSEDLFSFSRSPGFKELHYVSPQR